MNAHRKSWRAIGWPAVSTHEQAKDEKESIVAQKRDIIAVCDKQGWELIDMLEVPGFSRSYLTLREFADEALKAGIDAGVKLEDHFANRDFDVFVVRDGDRFGRSQSLFAYIAEYIMFVMKKSIYLINGGGLMNEQVGGRGWISMQSFSATKHIDDLVRYRSMGMKKRSERGLLVSAKNPLSHRTVRNNAGQAITTEVREDLRRLWNDLASVILEGVSWWDVERVLFEQYGHVRENGKRYTDNFFYRLVHNPVFWGHNALGMYVEGRKRDVQLFGPWVYDADESAPEGVIVHRDRFAAVWEGELATRMKTELRRRHETMIGSARPHNTSAFSGLLICSECGRAMTAHKVKGFLYYRCNTNRLRHRRHWEECPAKHYIKYETIWEYLTPRLEQIVATGNYDLTHEGLRLSGAQQLEQIDQEIAEAERELGQFILNKVRSKTPDIYEHLIEDAEDYLIALRNRMQVIRRDEQQRSRVSKSQKSAAEQLKETGVSALLEQHPRAINQLLHTLLAGNVLVCEEGQVIGIAKALHKRANRQ